MSAELSGTPKFFKYKSLLPLAAAPSDRANTHRVPHAFYMDQEGVSEHIPYTHGKWPYMPALAGLHIFLRAEL